MGEKKEERELSVALEKAKAGKDCWNRVVGSKGNNNDVCIICMPSINEELNRACICRMEDYFAAKYYRDFLIISHLNNKDIIGEYEFLQGKAVFLSEDEMSDLITFLRLVNMDYNVIVISMDEPFGSSSMMRKLNISIDEYVAGTFI